MMNLIGKYNVQFAESLVRTKKQVLRADRDNADEVKVEFYDDSDNNQLILHIIDGFHEETMQSDSKAGAKDRVDVHFSDLQIRSILPALEQYVDSLNVSFDNTPRRSPDPTGLEHPDGLPLGITKPVTYIDASIRANYADKGYGVKSTSKIYIDAENYYNRGKRVHMGITMQNTFIDPVYDYGCIDIFVEYKQIQRFLHSFKVANMWFN